MELRRFAADGAVPVDGALVGKRVADELLPITLPEVGGQVETLEVLAVDTARWDFDPRPAGLEGPGG